MEHTKLWLIQIEQASAELNHASCRFCKERAHAKTEGGSILAEATDLQQALCPPSVLVSLFSHNKGDKAIVSPKGDARQTVATSPRPKPTAPSGTQGHTQAQGRGIANLAMSTITVATGQTNITLKKAVAATFVTQEYMHTRGLGKLHSADTSQTKAP